MTPRRLFHSLRLGCMALAVGLPLALLGAACGPAGPSDPSTLPSATLIAQMRMTVERMKNWEQRVVNQKALDALAETGDLAERIARLPSEARTRIYTQYIPQGSVLALKVELETFEKSPAADSSGPAPLPGQKPLPGQAPARK